MLTLLTTACAGLLLLMHACCCMIVLAAAVCLVLLIKMLHCMKIAVHDMKGGEDTITTLEGSCYLRKRTL